MKAMLWTTLTVLSLLLHGFGMSQAANDDCGSAEDITDVFESIGQGDWVDCNMADGTFSYGLGSFEYTFADATVSSPNYLSDNCRGISDQTSPHLPDIWFKVALHNVDGGYLQGFAVLAFDTLEIAVYQGSCASLIQVDCFTPAPYSYTDLMTIPDTADADTMYIQLRSNRVQSYELFCITPVFGYVYYASSRPAIVWNGTTSTAEASRPSIKVIPNPSSDLIRIESDLSFQSIELYNLLGNRISEVTHSAGESLSVKELVAGIYLLKLIDQERNLYCTILYKL